LTFALERACAPSVHLQLGERIWNVLSVGEVTLLEIFNIDGVELLLSLHQLVNGDGVLLEGRVRVWNALVRCAGRHRPRCNLLPTPTPTPNLCRHIDHQSLSVTRR
jgi:hypothetical protein